MAILDEICTKIRNGQFEFSQHATDQSIIRHISMQEVREALEDSEVIEDYPNDRYGPSCLIFGFTQSKRPLHIQCSYPSRPLVKIITLYEPDPLRWIDFKARKNKMSDNEEWNETLVEKKVTYSIEVDGRFVIIEDVPARVNVETGERYFSPETVERLQQAVWEQYRPVRTIETPVYEYSAFVSEKNSKLKKWLKWMEIIQGEIQTLLRDTNMFWEVQDIIRENPRIQKPSAFYRYLGRTYLSHALAGLRRQIKPQKDSISLVGLLDEIAKNPEELSRNYYRSLCSHPDGPNISQIEMEGREGLEEVGVTDDSQLEDLIQMDDFAPYADASGEHVCPKMVKDDLKALKSTVEKHEEFADKRIAHWDKGEPDVIPTFGELDDCIKLLDKTYVKYHLLFYAESIDTLMPTYQYEWKKIFLEPWLKTGAGSAKGLIHIREDFDDELPDFKEYME